MNFINSNKNKELTKYIILFSNHIIEDANKFEAQEVVDKISFCTDELAFWAERQNPQRYQESLRTLLKWLFDKAEADF